MATHSGTLAWKIPWMEEPGRLQSMGSWRVGHNWVTSLSLFTFMHWRRNGNPLQCSCLEKIPGTGEPGGLPSMGWHRIGHYWSDLAAVADLLIAEKGGVCLFLNEECCFYVNQPEIVRDMTQQLREQIIKKREKLANSWGNWNNIWSWASWLLPVTACLFILFAAPLFGPCILNAVTQVITSWIESIKLQMVIAQNSP